MELADVDAGELSISSLSAYKLICRAPYTQYMGRTSLVRGRPIAR